MSVTLAAPINGQAGAKGLPATGMAVALLAILTLFRLGYAAGLGMAEDETYYWQWSRRLALAYYDQGPGIALFLRLGTLLLGDTALGIRAPVILLAAGTGWFVFLTARRWFGDAAALWTLGLLTVAPLIAAGSILATYDGPQVFFWAAALYAVTRTVQEERTGGWYVVGLLVGLGGLCKSTMILFAPCVLVFLLLVPAYRRWLRTPHPYLAFLLALALLLPVVLWNAQHEWMGFLHTFSLGNRTRNARPFRWFGDFIGGQALALSPLLFFSMVWALGRALSRPHPNGEARAGFLFTFAFSAPILLLCLVIALRSKLEINWPAPAHLTSVMAVAPGFAAAWASRRVKSRTWIAASVALALFLTAIAYFPALIPAMGVRLTARQAQKLNQTYGWPTIAQAVQAARETLAREGKPVFVAGVNYRVNSTLAFHLPDQPQTKGLYFRSRRDQYWIWTDPSALIGQNAVLAFDEYNADAVAVARRYFASVEAVPPVIVTRPGFLGPVKSWHLYLCRDFKGYDPETHVAGY